MDKIVQLKLSIAKASNKLGIKINISDLVQLKTMPASACFLFGKNSNCLFIKNSKLISMPTGFSVWENEGLKFLDIDNIGIFKIISQKRKIRI